mgnify:FL=1
MSMQAVLALAICHRAVMDARGQFERSPYAPRRDNTHEMFKEDMRLLREEAGDFVDEVGRRVNEEGAADPEEIAWIAFDYIRERQRARA